MHLSPPQKQQLLGAVVEAAQGRVPVVPCASDSHPAGVIAFARFARQCGCPAVIACPPYYFRFSQEEIKAFFNRVADSIPLPLLLYDIPQFTNSIEPETVALLSRHPNIAGIKESSGNLHRLRQILEQQDKPGFAVLIGPDELVLPSVLAGARACVSGTSNIVPEALVALFDSIRSGHLNTAKLLQNEIIRLIQHLSQFNFPTGFKIAAECRGHELGDLKQVLSSGQKDGLTRFKRETSDLIKELLERISR